MKKNPNLIKGATTPPRPNIVKSKTDLNSLFTQSFFSVPGDKEKTRASTGAASPARKVKKDAVSEEGRDNFNNLAFRQEVITSNFSLRDPARSNVVMVRGNQNKEVKEMVIPTIFKQNVKNNLKLRPFNDIISDVGDIQYFPA